MDIIGKFAIPGLGVVVWSMVSICMIHKFSGLLMIGSLVKTSNYIKRITKTQKG
ncbi:MAG: hypothetical protein G5Z43_001346 [Caldisphaeraceae archaeon]|nr:hypothetical protein [Caldisphaeraceae archaeon]